MLRLRNHSNAGELEMLKELLYVYQRCMQRCEHWSENLFLSKVLFFSSNRSPLIFCARLRDGIIFGCCVFEENL
jgi:hypothetical protein